MDTGRGPRAAPTPGSTVGPHWAEGCGGGPTWTLALSFTDPGARQTIAPLACSLLCDTSVQIRFKPCPSPGSVPSFHEAPVMNSEVLKGHPVTRPCLGPLHRVPFRSGHWPPRTHTTLPPGRYLCWWFLLFPVPPVPEVVWGRGSLGPRARVPCTIPGSRSCMDCPLLPWRWGSPHGWISVSFGNTFTWQGRGDLRNPVGPIERAAL